MVRSRRRLIAVVIVGIVGLCLAQQKEEDNGKKMTAASKDKKKVIAGILITPESLGLGKAVKLERDEASVDAEEGFSKGVVTVEARIGTSKVELVYDIYVCKSLEVAKRIAKSRMLGYFLAQGGVPIGLPLETAGIKADYGNVFYIRLNLVRPKPNAKRYVLAGLWFAVRNIIVVIRPKNEAANGHILPIAKKVADYLRKQPTYKSLEASGLCPKIIAKPEKTTTTAKVAMEEIEEGKFTPRYFIDPIPVRFKVDDPSNLKVRLKKFAFEGTIDWNADKGAYCFSWEYYDSEKAGFNKPLKCKIRFVAVNERLLWSTKEITITILPPKK